MPLPAVLLVIFMGATPVKAYEFDGSLSECDELAAELNKAPEKPEGAKVACFVKPVRA
jgi:hypothetical protein